MNVIQEADFSWHDQLVQDTVIVVTISYNSRRGKISYTSSVQVYAEGGGDGVDYATDDLILEIANFEAANDVDKNDVIQGTISVGEKTVVFYDTYTPCAFPTPDKALKAHLWLAATGRV